MVKKTRNVPKTNIVLVVKRTFLCHDTIKWLIFSAENRNINNINFLILMMLGRFEFMKIKDINVCVRLGEERKRLNLNQNKIATYCEVNVKSIGRWEKNVPIPADKLALLAQLGYDITYILTGVKLVPQVNGLEAASKVWNSKNHIDNANLIPVDLSAEQEIWLGILENLADGDNNRLKQIGLALIGYSQAKAK